MSREAGERTPYLKGYDAGYVAGLEKASQIVWSTSLSRAREQIDRTLNYERASVESCDKFGV
jgi:hypothetical protein